MRPRDLTCRICGRDYGDPEGCGTCLAAKRNIDWPAMKDQSVELLPLAQKAIELLETNLDRLQKDMKQSVGGKSGHYYPEHAREAAMLARSLTFIMGEARKLEDRDEKRVAAMGFEEKIRLFMEFIDGLPQEHQLHVARRVAGLLAEAGEDADVLK